MGDFYSSYDQVHLIVVVSYLVINKPRKTIREDLKGDLYNI